MRGRTRPRPWTEHQEVWIAECIVRVPDPDNSGRGFDPYRNYMYVSRVFHSWDAARAWCHETDSTGVALATLYVAVRDHVDESLYWREKERRFADSAGSEVHTC
jgi:hypothetical protein